MENLQHSKSSLDPSNGSQRWKSPCEKTDTSTSAPTLLEPFAIPFAAGTWKSATNQLASGLHAFAILGMREVNCGCVKQSRKKGGGHQIEGFPFPDPYAGHPHVTR